MIKIVDWSENSFFIFTDVEGVTNLTVMGWEYKKKSNIMDKITDLNRPTCYSFLSEEQSSNFLNSLVDIQKFVMIEELLECKK